VTAVEEGRGFDTVLGWKVQGGRRAMGAGEEEEAATTAAWEKVEAKEERIMVSVRVRPLNGRESGDSSDWECISPTTVMFRSTVPDRAMFPTAYTYGKQQ
jgi:centromeric protein E